MEGFSGLKQNPETGKVECYEDGKFVGYIGSTGDEHELKTTEEKLDELVEELNDTTNN